MMSLVASMELARLVESFVTIFDKDTDWEFVAKELQKVAQHAGLSNHPLAKNAVIGIDVALQLLFPFIKKVKAELGEEATQIIEKMTQLLPKPG